MKLNNVGPLSQILLRYKPFYECKQCVCAQCNTVARRLLPVAVQATDVSRPLRAETLLLLPPCSNKCTENSSVSADAPLAKDSSCQQFIHPQYFTR